MAGAICESNLDDFLAEIRLFRSVYSADSVFDNNWVCERASLRTEYERERGVIANVQQMLSERKKKQIVAQWVDPAGGRNEA